MTLVRAAGVPVRTHASIFKPAAVIVALATRLAMRLQFVRRGPVRLALRVKPYALSPARTCKPARVIVALAGPNVPWETPAAQGLAKTFKTTPPTAEPAATPAPVEKFVSMALVAVLQAKPTAREPAKISTRIRKTVAHAARLARMALLVSKGRAWM